MSRINEPRPLMRAAVLDYVASASQPDAIGPEEREFLEALRRIVERSPAEELWEKYRGGRPDRHARIFARFAD